MSPIPVARCESAAEEVSPQGFVLGLPINCRSGSACLELLLSTAAIEIKDSVSHSVSVKQSRTKDVHLSKSTLRDSPRSSDGPPIQK